MENGPMMVIPGSYRGPTYDHHGPDGRFCGAMDPNDPDVDYAKALPCLGNAGSITIHHVLRAAITASADQLLQARSRRFLPRQHRAADAWPLLGLKERDRDVQRAASGRAAESRAASRTGAGADASCRRPAHQGSIYENQRTAGRRFFATADDGAAGRGGGVGAMLTPTLTPPPLAGEGTSRRRRASLPASGEGRGGG